jgi:uncharacterized repeat protein (TIGR03803 family)
MLRKTLNYLPILVLTLSLLPMSVPAQAASRTMNLKGTNSGGVKANRTKARNVKAHDIGSPFQVLHSFTGGTDGDAPSGGVNLDASGNIYGATTGAGTAGDYGTLYKIDTAGNYTVLYDFQNGSDGYSPIEAPLPPDASGNMYGTADGGGVGGQGTIYQFNPTTNTFTTLYSFSGPDGSGPMGLTPDSSGNFYGFTPTGGPSDAGTVFMWSTTTGALNTLYSFTGGSDGQTPFFGSLVRDASGNLYGTTSRGGNTNYGAVFELSYSSSGNCPAGSNQTPGSSWCETVLYSFAASPDVELPESGVAKDASGNLYGTGRTKGLYRDGGVWKLTPLASEPGGVCPAGSNTGNGWCETVLHSFAGQPDGKTPEATVVLDSMGNLYGATQLGGVNNFGSLYAISASGQYIQLYSFDFVNDGDSPYGTPALSPSGTLYGTASGGGGGDYGTVWSFQPPQWQTIAFTSFIPAYAKKSDTFTVTASATSGLPVALTASGVCTVPANSVSPATYTMTSNTGTCSVIANQVGNSSYFPAAQVSTTVTATAKVTPITPITSLTSNAPSSGAAYGSNFTVTATSNSTGALSITATPASVCSISGATVTMNSGTGNCVVEAKWKSNEYFAAAAATPITIAAAPLTGTLDWTEPAAITYGMPLTATQLDASTNSNGKLVYSPKAGKVLAAGSQTLSVTLDASKDYTGTTATVPLTVNQATTTTTVNSTTVGSTYLKATVSFTTAGQYGGKLTGDVTVTATTGESCKASPASGTCTIAFKSSSAGTAETLTAVYPGDANNTTSNGTASYTVPTSGN